MDSEFGASPLGKTDIRGGAAATAAPPEMTIVDAAPLPDIYGDLYGDTGEGNVLLKTQVAQVRDSLKEKSVFAAFPSDVPFSLFKLNVNYVCYYCS